MKKITTILFFIAAFAMTACSAHHQSPATPSGTQKITDLTEALETPPPTECIKDLLEQPYVNKAQASELCLIYSQTTLGCAMDLYDMGYSPNFYDDLEYCLAPNGRP